MDLFFCMEGDLVTETVVNEGGAFRELTTEELDDGREDVPRLTADLADKR